VQEFIYMNEKEQYFLSSLRRYAKRWLWFNFWGGFTRFVLIVLILWISVALADHLFFFSRITRWGLWFVNAPLLIALVYKLLYPPLYALRKYNRDKDLTPFARMLGASFSVQEDEFVIAWQLMTDHEQPGTSPGLRAEAVRHFLNKYDSSVFASKIHLADFFPSIKWVLAIILGALLIMGFRFQDISIATLRLLNPTADYLPTPQYRFRVEPGNAYCLKGKPIQFSVHYSGPPLQEVHLELALQDKPKETRSYVMQKSDSVYVLKMRDIRQTVYYYVWGLPVDENHFGDRIKSERYMIKVLVPPRVEDLQVVVIPPSYSALKKSRMDKNVGDISALTGSEVELHLHSNKLLASGQVVFASGKEIPLNISGPRISARFTVKKEDSYHIMIRDTSGLENQKPIEYQIGLIPDDPPSVDIIQPEGDVESNLDGLLIVKMEVHDDYGIRNVGLKYRILKTQKSETDSSWQYIPIEKGQRRVKQENPRFIWDFNTLPLTFEDVIEYYGQAVDNNVISGPGIGKSKILQIRFPSLQDIFADFDQKQEKQVEELEDVSDKAKELKKALKDLDREMHREKKINWEKKQEIEKSIRKQKEMQKRVEEIKKNLDEMIRKLDQKNMLSPKILEKYTKLQELFQKVVTPELMKALQNLQKAMDKADARQVKQALQQLKLNQEAFERNIERAMELLKQVQFEQRLDALIQKARHLKEEQKKISERIEDQQNQRDQSAQDIAKTEKNQEKAFKDFRQSLERFRREERLAQFPETQQQVDSLSAHVKSDRMAEKMQQMQQSLQKNRLNSAQQSSQNMERNFSRYLQSLQMAQKHMLQKSKKKIQQAMRRALQQILELSQKQESLQRRTGKLSPLSDQYSKIAEQQEGILQNFNKTINDIIRLSKKTFFISPNMNMPLQAARQNMQRSLNQLSERNRSLAQGNQRQAMSSMNISALQLKAALSQLGKSKSGTGFAQFMKQLQKMAGLQGQINNQSMNLFQQQGNGGMLSAQQRAQMRRLAAQQAAMSQALKQLSEQKSQQENTLGQLGKVARDMEEVAKDLLKQNLNRRTIERQQKILSRLLDAQKSVRQRKYSKKRKAEQAKKYAVKDPGEIGATTVAEKEKIEQALRAAMQAGYEHDYRELIEAYFKQLLQRESK